MTSSPAGVRPPTIDDSTLNKPRARHMGLVTRHRSGKHKKPVRGINLITLLWSDGDRKIPVDYRIYSKTKHDHFWELLLMATARGFSPKDVLFECLVQRLGLVTSPKMRTARGAYGPPF